jgi:hypothetical protein
MIDLSSEGRVWEESCVLGTFTYVKHDIGWYQGYVIRRIVFNAYFTVLN